MISETRADRLHAILTQHFQPVRIEIQDDSARHASHSGAREGGQTHFNVLVVAQRFEGQSRVQRSRMVHEVLAQEFAEGLHALSLVLRTPAEAGLG